MGHYEINEEQEDIELYFDVSGFAKAGNCRGK